MGKMIVFKYGTWTNIDFINKPKDSELELTLKVMFSHCAKCFLLFNY